MSAPLSRRTVIKGGLAVSAGVAVTALAGCTGDDGPSAEELAAQALVPLAQAGLADEKTARAMVATTTEYAAALTLIAEQRAQHAQALREEITRLHQDTAKSISPSTSAPATSAAPAPALTVTQLRERLRTSTTQAHNVAVAQSGYAAGLAGAISASVNSMVEVQLS